MTNTAQCWDPDCDHEFEYEDDDTFTNSDIIEGQYHEWECVQCPECGLSVDV